MNLEEARIANEKILELIKTDLSTVRTGRATSSLVENIIITAYGDTKLRVLEVGTINVMDPQTILITPFDASIIGEIQKGVMESNVGLTPVVDGQVIRISIPPLSGERRQELIALVKQKLESGRVQVRQVRHEAMDQIKKDFNEKLISEDEMIRLEKEIQNLTDKTILVIDDWGKRKEEELLQV